MRDQNEDAENDVPEIINADKHGTIKLAFRDERVEDEEGIEMPDEDDEEPNFRSELPAEEDRERTLIECCNYCGETWGVGVPITDDRECLYHGELPERRIYEYYEIDVVDPLDWFDRMNVDIDDEVREP